jgi:hypothetical protein
MEKKFKRLARSSTITGKEELGISLINFLNIKNLHSKKINFLLAIANCENMQV